MGHTARRNPGDVGNGAGDSSGGQLPAILRIGSKGQQVFVAERMLQGVPSEWFALRGRHNKISRQAQLFVPNPEAERAMDSEEEIDGKGCLHRYELAAEVRCIEVGKVVEVQRMAETTEMEHQLGRRQEQHLKRILRKATPCPCQRGDLCRDSNAPR
jgi:hypothetical protein